MSFCKYLINPLVFLFSIVAIAGNEKPYYCGYEPYYNEVFYEIVEQKDLIRENSLQLFAYCPYSALCDGAQTPATNQNLLEWQNFLGAAFSSAEVSALIYQKDYSWYENLLNSNKSKEALGKKLLENNLQPFAKYMMLAKKCENIASNSYSGYGWYQGEREEQEDKKPKLLETAVSLFKKEKNAFLKNRYAFQMVRLAHYLQENEAAMNFFDKYMNLTPETSYIYHRGLEQRSGAAYNLQKFDDAAQGFIKVYAALPERRRSCALSLGFLQYHDLQVGKMDPEAGMMNEILHFFRAFHGNGNVFREMMAIEAINPNSVYLETLAIREAVQIQEQVFQKYDPHFSAGFSSEENFSISENFQNLLNNKAENNELENQDLWKIIAGIIALEGKNIALAKKHLSTIENGSEFYLQAERLSFATDVFQLEKIERERINELFLKLKNHPGLFTHTPLTAYFFNHVSQLYEKEGNILTAHFVYIHYNGYSSSFENWEQVLARLNVNPNMRWKYEYVEGEIIERFEDFLNLNNKTDYEKLVVSQIKSEPYDYLHELKGTYFLSNNEREQAISAFEKIKKPESFYSKFFRPYIFSAAINERFDTPFSQQSDAFHENYPEIFEQDLPRYESLWIGENEESYRDNKLKLAKTLQKLVEMTVEDPKNAADYYYMLGNAWYNMSEEGWFLNTLHYVTNNSRNQILGYNYGYGYEEGESEQSQFHYWANLYYRKALEAQGDLETKAKATYMLAKTNSCYFTLREEGNKVEVCNEHQDYFESLRDDFSDSQFQKEVIKECSWYRSFLNI